jgi:glycerol-3-phosphate acyltransferase PlsY
MPWIIAVTMTIVGYLLGSIPFGLVIVRWKTGQDLRQIGSGRTGGTNAARAAGFWAGLATALLDIFKVTFSVWLASWLSGGNSWTEALAGAAAILGHNNSLFLIKRVRNEQTGQSRWEFPGGAGGAPAVGGALALFPISVLFMLPAGLFFLFVIGYASVATLSVGLVAILVFVIRALFYDGPWGHVLYGVLTLTFQLWALRPNLGRLFNGTERVYSKSLRGRALARADTQTENNSK